MLYTIRAELVETKDNKVHLRSESGKDAWIPIKKLSTPDRRYIAHRVRVKESRSKLSKDAYKNVKHGIEIRFPEGFTSTTRQRLDRFITEFGDPSGATMELNVLEMQPGITYKAVMDRNKAAVKKKDNMELARTINEVVKADGRTAEYFEYVQKSPLQTDQIRVYGVQVGQKLYWVFATTQQEKFEEMSPIFDASVETLKFLNAPQEDKNIESETPVTLPGT